MRFMYRRKLLISPEALIFFGSGKFEVVGKALPPDTRLVGCRIISDGSPNGRIELDVESAEFEPHPQGFIELDSPVVRRLA